MSRLPPTAPTEGHKKEQLEFERHCELIEEQPELLAGHLATARDLRPRERISFG